MYTPNKIADSTDWNLPVANTIPVKCRRDGRLTGVDRSALRKVASDELMTNFSGDKIKFHPDEVPTLIIALGADEFYGPNRRLDGFPIDGCRGYHRTFVTHGKYFRDHKISPAPSFGRVIDSAVNNRGGWIELLVGLNGSRDTCRYNGGEVADQECELLARGESFPTSMSCYAPEDYCSICGHETPKAIDRYRCGRDCPSGGLKYQENLGAVMEDGRLPYMITKRPLFVDISGVWRPADPISYATGLPNATIVVRKEAADAASVEVVSVPATHAYAQDVCRVVRNLAAAEAKLKIADLAVGSRVTLPDGNRVEQLGSLMARGALLRPDEFALATGWIATKNASVDTRDVSNIFRTAAAYLTPTYVHASPYARLPLPKQASDHQLNTLADQCAIDPLTRYRFNLKNTDANEPRFAVPSDPKFACDYAVYVAGIFDSAKHTKFPLTSSLVVSHNRT